MSNFTPPKNLSFALLAKRPGKPTRIPPPIIPARPNWRGSRHYLRALRAAEMAIWDAADQSAAGTSANA